MIFVDTGAWIALEVESDVHHAEALGLWRRVGRGEFGAVLTSDHVLSESLTAVRLELGAEGAESLGRRVFESALVHILWTTPEVFRAGWGEMRKYRDKKWSLTDCLSFVHMRGAGTDTAFSFDKNFEQAGFHAVP